MSKVCTDYTSIYQATPDCYPFIAFHKVGDVYCREIAESHRIEGVCLLATNCFSKWVEVEAFAWIRDVGVISFLWRNVNYRFGVPQEIITRNVTYFTSSKF